MGLEQQPRARYAMSIESKDLPYVTDDYADADHAARMRSSRHGRAYFIGARISEEGEPVYLVPPLTECKRFYGMGWLPEDAYGEPHAPHYDIPF